MTALREAIDYTTLGWVKPELDETLRQARIEIEGFADDPGDGARMRLCAAYLHQVQGTLRMVELYAPAMVAEEMELLSQALQDGEVQDTDAACATLMRGVVLLPDYLERLQSGHKDIPIVLLPLLNELRAARGSPGLSESVLFAPDLQRSLPDSVGSGAPATDESGPARAVAGLQSAMAAWPEDDAPGDPAALQASLESLLPHASHEPARRMLWVAASVAEALRDGALVAGEGLRQAFASVERESRRMFSNEDHGLSRAEATLEPTRQLLYHVTHSEDRHPVLRELRETFELDSQQPTESELLHAQGSLSGRNRALLDTVAAAIKEDLLRIKDALDLHLRTSETDVARLQPQVESLERVADTLGMLGLGVARTVIQTQRDALHAMVDGTAPADEGALLDIAGALLYVDATLDDQVAHLGSGDDAQTDDAALAASESQKLLDVIVREATANFADARQAFVAFVETSWDHSELAEVPRLLQEVSGALRMLELEQPSNYLTAVRLYTEAELLGRKRVPNGRQLDTFADALASLEYYLEALRDSRGNREDILDVARNSLETLGYWPLPAQPGTFATPIADDEDEQLDVDADVAQAVASLIDRGREQAGEPARPTPEETPQAPAEKAAPPVAAAGERSGGFEVTGDEIDDEIREVFLEELAEEIDNLDQLLPLWRAEPDNFERLRPIRRVFHTLKGSGRLVGARTLGEFSWKIESMLNRVLDGSRAASPAVVAMVDQAFYTLPQLESALRGEGRVVADLAAMQASAERIANGDETMPEAAPPLADVEGEAIEATESGQAGETPSADASAGDAADVDETVPASVDTLLLEILEVEIAGHLETVDAWTSVAGSADPALATDELVRAIHTMNGAFAMTEVPEIGATLAPAESYVKRLMAAKAAATPAGIAALAELAQVVRRAMTGLQAADSHVPRCGALAERLVELRDTLPEATVIPLEELSEDANAVGEKAGTDITDLDLDAYADRSVLDELPDAAAGADQAHAASLAAAEAERIEAERAEAERAEAERAEAERIEAERIEAERTEAERAEAERAEAERAEAERAEAERAEAERAEAERAEAERAEAEHAEAEHAEAERAEAERAEAERIEAERLEAERLEAERLEAERLEAERLEAERAEAERVPPDPAVAALLSRAVDEDPDEALDITGLDPELIDIFVEESSDLLDHSDGLLAKLRESPNEREALVGLQRDLHTIKGGARMAGILPIGELGHAMESLLEAVVEQRGELGRDGIPMLERGFDRLHAMVTRAGERKAISASQELVDAFDARARGESIPVGDAQEDLPARMPAPKVELKPLSAPMGEQFDQDEDDIGVRTPQEQVRIRADLLDRLVNYAGEVAIYRARLEQQLGAFRGAMDEMEQTNARLRDQLRRLDIETEAQIIARYQREHETADATFDPLELDRFSTLQQLSRALGESAADMASLQGTLDDLTRQYETLLLQQSRVSSDLQEGLMRTRMVPFDALVPRLRRIVRQASAETGKDVQLKLDGAQGELDRNVLERMTAPLEHMLRNAVAHGLELPDERRRANKSPEGEVRIAVRREGSEVVLEVSDDGAGLDRAAIRRRAEQRGLVRADAVLTDTDLDMLIFEPGFSTAEEVSRLAGRGVGMDVVASEVRQLGGTLDISTEKGEGTSFTMRLPQTLAVTQAVFVRIGETSFAVPIASVRGVGRIDRDALRQAGVSYEYGGEEYAVHDLGGLVGHAPARAEGQLQMPLLLIRSGDLRAAVAIDQIVGNREIVVKPVGPQVASIPGIFGATIMGDGRVVVILDVAPLVRRQATRPHDYMPEPVAEQRAVPLVMVVDDSVTMRKVSGRVLERHNFEVATAKDGIDALEHMNERVPDLMLLDIEMPRMDGYELATHMKADARLRNVPIIMITSRTGEKHRQRAFEIGVERYLGKPYQENELVRNVYDLLKLDRHDA